MGKPIINNIVAFDSSEEMKITFNYTGDQAYSNSLVIKDRDTLKIVYSNIISTQLLQNIVTANTLENGKAYLAQITVYNQYGVASTLSDTKLFYCFTQPIFQLNIDNDEIIRNSYINLGLYYSQPEGEELSTYYYILYDNNNQALITTPDMYDTDIEYQISGLLDNSYYYIEAYGLTKYGTKISTGKIKFTTLYSTTTSNIFLSAQNEKMYGRIKLQTKIRVVSYEIDKTPVYIDDTYIDLIDNILKYSGGFNFNDDFKISFSCKGIKKYNYKPIIEMIDINENKIQLIPKWTDTYSFVDDEEDSITDTKMFFCLSIKNSHTSMTLYTDTFTELNNIQNVIVTITKKNNLYGLNYRLN